MPRGLRLGLGTHILAAAAAAPAYQTESSALFVRMASAGAEPDATRKGHIDTLIAALKVAGVWAKTDVLYVLAAHSAPAALLNWISASHDAAANGAIAFVADRGYTGNAVGDYLSTAFDPDALTGINFVETVGGGTDQSQHVGVFVLTANSVVAFDAVAGAAFRVVATSSGSGANPNGRLASAGGADAIVPPSGDAPHHIVAVRNGAGSAFGYRDGVAGAEMTSLCTTASTTALAICAFGAGGTPTGRQTAIVHAGGKLTGGEVAALHSALLIFLQALGAVP